MCCTRVICFDDCPGAWFYFSFYFLVFSFAIECIESVQQDKQKLYFEEKGLVSWQVGNERGDGNGKKKKKKTGGRKCGERGCYLVCVRASPAARQLMYCGICLLACAL